MAVTEATIGPRTAKLVDVCADASGFAYAYQDDASGQLVLGQIALDGTARPFHAETIGTPNSFPVIARWNNATWVAWRQNPTSEGWLWNVTSGKRYPLGVVHGNYPIAITNGMVAWLCDAQHTVKRAALNDIVVHDGVGAHVEVFAYFAHGTGIIYAAPLMSWDTARLAYEGVVNGREAGALYVGENPSGIDRNIVRDKHTGHVLDLWPGQFSPRPRIAVNGDVYCVVTSEGPGARAALFSREDLKPPVVAPPPPPVPADIPWKTDLTKTVDIAPFIDAASTAHLDLGNGRGMWWLKKSPERSQFGDDIVRGGWGEFWVHDDRYIGLLEDRSTAYRMVSRARPKTHSHTNTTRDRISPEEVVAANARGENLGDPHTLPLASYTLTPRSLWMPRVFTGRFEKSYTTTYKWWDLPQFGGVWEEWPNMRVTIALEAGYGRFNGLEVHARQKYLRNDGKYEFNYLGPSGWSRHEAYHADGTLEFVSPGSGPAEKGPMFTSRFTPRWPIYFDEVVTPPKEPKPLPLPDDVQMVNFMARLHIEGYMGELRRAGGIFESPDPDHSLIRDQRRPDVVLDDKSIAVWTGRYVQHFSKQTTDHHERAVREVLRQLHDSHEARTKRGDVAQPPASNNPAIAGRLRVEHGRLVNDAGAFNWQGMSAFCLIGHGMQGRWAEVHRQIDRAAAAGRNVLRVFCMLNPRNGGFGPVTRFTPDMAGWGGDAEEVVEYAAARGIYTQLNIFADCSEEFGGLYTSFEDRRRVVRQVAVRFKDTPSVIFRLANEPYQNGWSEADDRELLILADDLAEILGHRDFLIGDVKDDGSESGSPEYKARVARVAAHCNVLCSHPDRAESVGRERPIEHLKSVYEALHGVARHCAIVFDEPRGMGSHRQPGRRDNRPAVAVAEACNAAIMGCGYTLHAILEQDDAVPGLEESRVAFQIPTSVDYEYANAGLGESWLEGFGGFYKVRTCDNGTIGYAVGHGSAHEHLSMTPRSGWRFEGEPIIDIVSDGLAVVVRKGVRG